MAGTRACQSGRPGDSTKGGKVDMTDMPVFLQPGDSQPERLQPGDFQPDYRWSDLISRRAALGLARDVLADTLGVSAGKFWSREGGNTTSGAYLIDELNAMEAFVQQRAAAFIDDAINDDGDTTVTLKVVVDPPEFEKTYPDAKTRRDGIPYPFTLEYVAAGRAAAELTRRGYVVEVYRGDFRADLVTRRAAVGLPKTMAGQLLGLGEKKYNLWETGKKSAPKAAAGAGAPFPVGLVRELQKIDDFITETAAALDVVELGGVKAVVLVDSQAEFERTYPEAKTIRGGTPYPLRVLRVAASRRVSQLGESGRVVVLDGNGEVVTSPAAGQAPEGEESEFVGIQFEPDDKVWRDQVYGPRRG